MATEFVQMGKRGTLVVPAKLRKKLGLVDGCLLVLNEANGTIEIRLAQLEISQFEAPPPDARLLLAQSLLGGAESLGDYLAAIEEVRRMGFDAEKVPHERYSG